MPASSATVGVDMIFRVQTQFPWLVATGTPVVISSRLTTI